MVVRGVDLDGLDCEGFLCVLGEHGDKDVVDYLGFCLVCRCYINEDIACFGADFGVIGIDYWGHGADCSIGVKNNRIHRGVSNDVEVSREVFVVLLQCQPQCFIVRDTIALYLIELHELNSVH